MVEPVPAIFSGEFGEGSVDFSIEPAEAVKFEDALHSGILVLHECLPGEPENGDALLLLRLLP